MFQSFKKMIELLDEYSSDLTEDFQIFLPLYLHRCSEVSSNFVLPATIMNKLVNHKCTIKTHFWKVLRILYRWPWW